MPEEITSLQNRQVKQIVKLRQRRYRDRQQLTVVEGVREAKLALDNNVIPQSAFICPTSLAREESETMLAKLYSLAKERRTHLYETTPAVFAKLAYRDDASGVLLVIPYLQRDLSDLSVGPSSFVAVIEDAEKPGNLGAVLRTADAVGAAGVITCAGPEGSGTDLHNPNVIRASLGALFSVPVAFASTIDVIEWLQERQIRIIVSTPTATLPYTRVDMSGRVALVMGSEAHGVSEKWFSTADEQVVIPMEGTVNSLNLAVSSALLLYEAHRQRTDVEDGEVVAEIALN